jgi:predicted DNA-binding transcriptional regulator AlpA
MTDDNKTLTPGPATLDQLLTETEVARILKLTMSGLQKLRKRGRGPSHLRLGNRMIRYRPQAIADWLENACAERPKKRSADDSH